MAEKVLVIGGTGPTGPLVVEGLRARAAEITILHRGAHELPELMDLEHIHVDPHKPELLEPLLKGRYFDVAVVMYGRLEGIAPVLAKKVGHLIAIGGTNYALGDHEWLAEDHPYRANVAGEKMLQAELSLFEQADQGAFSATLLRYANVYGPRQLAPREWSLVRRFLDGRRRFILCDSGIALETRLSARNAAQAVLAAYDNLEKAAGNSYNVADAYPLTDRERLSLVAETMGISDYEVVSVPTHLAQPAWFWGVGRSLNKIGEHPEIGHRLLSCRKIEETLGFTHVITPEDGLRETVRFYMDHPPAPHGSIEQKLGDPFDYAGEDRFLEVWDRLSAELSSVQVAPVNAKHGYRLIEDQPPSSGTPAGPGNAA